MSNRCTSRANKLTAEGSCECPNLWHLKQRRGFGICGRTLQFKYPALMADGNLGLLKGTPWSESPSKISVSEERKRSGSEMTPRHEFKGRRRRIPFDFQRTSLAGLALDSAISSGLGRAPRSAIQDSIQAPPGATRQAGLYTS
ncbi:hypothetical protein TNCV_490641 [Trichonephila clavipes]|nr:hypothetical protein TNCV_490641 [Trichonephila clavipes]